MIYHLKFKNIEYHIYLNIKGGLIAFIGHTLSDAFNIAQHGRVGLLLVEYSSNIWLSYKKTKVEEGKFFILDCKKHQDYKILMFFHGAT